MRITVLMAGLLKSTSAAPPDGDDGLAQEDADGHDFDCRLLHDLTEEAEDIEGDDHAAGKESEADKVGVA